MEQAGSIRTAGRGLPPSSGEPPGPPIDVDVAVVGAGASGLLSVAHLGRMARRLGTTVSVALIDPSPVDHAGLAYSTTNPDHLMNVRACNLSAYDDEPSHFLDWYRAIDGAAGPNTFVPRREFGRYLHSVADSVRDAVVLHRVGTSCVGADVARTGARSTVLQLADGGRVVTDHVVLALGNAHPRPLGAGPSARVIDDPWDASRLEAIGPDDHVVVVGTGLTAIDTLLALEAGGHRGRTTIASRHGRWPAIHTGAHPCGPAPAGFTAADFGPVPTARSIVARVRRALDDRGDASWQSVLDQLRPQTAKLWRALDDAERARFLRHAQPLWEAHRHRLAPPIGERLARILADARVVKLAGRVRVERADDDGAQVSITGRSGCSTIDVQWVINCTGPARDVRCRRDPLIDALLARGDAFAGWQGWGLAVDDCGNLRTSSPLGSTMCTIGPMRLGHDYETTAIPEIRVQAAALAASLVRPQQRADVA